MHVTGAAPTRGLMAFCLALVLASGGVGLRLIERADASPEVTRVFATTTRSQADFSLTVHLMERYGCSTSGLEPGVFPRSALLRGANGLVRPVSFERGFAAWEGRRSGTLVAVCRMPLR